MEPKDQKIQAYISGSLKARILAYQAKHKFSSISLAIESLLNQSPLLTESVLSVTELPTESVLNSTESLTELVTESVSINTESVGGEVLMGE